MSVELVPGETAIAIKEETHIVQETIILEGEITSTDVQDGDEPKKEKLTVRIERRELTIIRSLYIEARFHRESDFEDEVEPTCGERCTDLCCQSCTCDFENPYKEKKFIHMERRGIVTDTLRRGRAKGWNNVYINIIFPLIQDTVRDIWIALELATVLIGLILSIASLSVAQNGVFNFLHFALIALSSTLAIIDGISVLKNCKSCKGCFRGCCNMDCRSNRIADVEVSGEVETKDCFNKCCSCYKTASNIIDVVRIILTEMLVYPVLICDIFELIIGRGYEGDTAGDRLGFALFILSCFSLLLYVYVARIIVLVGMIKHVQEALDYGTGSKFSTPALWYQIYFFIHVVLQMLLQVLIIIAIGAKIRSENRHFYEDGNTDESIHVSGLLWYMMVSGYVLPTMGFFTFFLVTYHWTQEFPVGLLLNMIRFLKMGDPDDIVHYQGKQAETRKTMLEVIERFVRIDRLTNDFTELRDTGWFSKFGYPFTSPVLVCICIVYSSMHIAFISCTAIGEDAATMIISFLLIVIGAVANAYVAVVTTLWISFATAVLIALGVVAAAVAIAIAVVIAFGIFIGCCVILVLCSGED